jgi:hypothetical protein
MFFQEVRDIRQATGSRVKNHLRNEKERVTH